MTRARIGLTVLALGALAAPGCFDEPGTADGTTGGEESSDGSPDGGEPTIGDGSW
jgi:hypothetical protein